MIRKIQKEVVQSRLIDVQRMREGFVPEADLKRTVTTRKIKKFGRNKNCFRRYVYVLF